MKKINFSEGGKILKSGGVIIYPTDTAYGIGCRIDDEKAVRRLFSARNRPENKAVPVLFDSIQRVADYVLPFDTKVKDLMEKYWPGALTIVLNSVKNVNKLVTGGTNTLGARIPDYEELVEMISYVGVPIVGTSANMSGEKTPFLFEELDPQLVSLVDGVIESPSKGKSSSTVIDCTTSSWKILRQGGVELKI